MSQFLFITISIVGLLTALGTVLARNLIHAALFLVAFFFVVACQFAMLDAEFLAIVQVLIYIGAVAILLVFGIMLTDNVQGDQTTTIPKGWIIPSLLTTIGFFFVLTYGINKQVGVKDAKAWTERTRPSLVETKVADPGLKARQRAANDMGLVVGEQMLTRYAVGFEAAGVLLTAALVGAIALSQRSRFEEASGFVSKTEATELVTEGAVL